jgi:hypothetical protein
MDSSCRDKRRGTPLSRRDRTPPCSAPRHHTPYLAPCPVSSSCERVCPSLSPVIPDPSTPDFGLSAEPDRDRAACDCEMCSLRCSRVVNVRRGILSRTATVALRMEKTPREARAALTVYSREHVHIACTEGGANETNQSSRGGVWTPLLTTITLGGGSTPPPEMMDSKTHSQITGKTP